MNLSVSPATDTIGGIVTISGSNFSPSGSLDTVTFNAGVYAVVINAYSTQLTVVVQDAWQPLAALR